MDYAQTEGGQTAHTLNTLEYDGKLGKIYGIWFVNILLNMITMGIYSFWGRTRMRKYVASSYRLGGDRFEFTGTGMEIFVGLLLAMPVFLLLYLPPILLIETHPIAGLLFIPLFILVIYAIYSAMRYRLSRTVWRGIRGRLAGSGFRFAWECIWRYVANVLTLGFMVPYHERKIHQYVTENTYYGDQKAEFDGDSKGLYLLNFLTLHIPYIVFVTAVGLGAIMIAKIDAEGLEQGSGQPSLAFYGFLLGFYALMFVAFIPRLWYQAAKTRKFYGHTTIGNFRLNATHTGGGLLGLIAGNLIIVIFTLGLGAPIAFQRTLKFIARHFGVWGDLDTSNVGQSEQTLKAIGEGFEGAFGLDTGLI